MSRFGEASMIRHSLSLAGALTLHSGSIAIGLATQTPQKVEIGRVWSAA